MPSTAILPLPIFLSNSRLCLCYYRANSANGPGNMRAGITASRTHAASNDGTDFTAACSEPATQVSENVIDVVFFGFSFQSPIRRSPVKSMHSR
ncbi:MAG TPA: hypothetical protein VHN74_09615 [Candidatus Angelobacter sp.]|nr:hypothetical protein [Candidatus Angelobacter sp.]